MIQRHIFPIIYQTYSFLMASRAARTVLVIPIAKGELESCLVGGNSVKVSHRVMKDGLTLNWLRRTRSYTNFQLTWRVGIPNLIQIFNRATAIDKSGDVWNMCTKATVGEELSGDAVHSCDCCLKVRLQVNNWDCDLNDFPRKLLLDSRMFSLVNYEKSAKIVNFHLRSITYLHEGSTLRFLS